MQEQIYPGEKRKYRNTKESFGVALCRKEGAECEILLVRKRHTYSYCEFVYGHYNPRDLQSLYNLLCGTTLEEKMDIASLKFEQIWYRMWLTYNTKPGYLTAKKKYEECFLRDGGAKLREMLSGAHSVQLLWEIPKGRKKYKNESPIQCAVREFGEETNVRKSLWRITPGTRTHQHTDRKIRYKNLYFIGVAGKNQIDSRLYFRDRSQICEVSNVSWMTMREVRAFCSRDLEKTVRGIFNYYLARRG